MICPCDGAILKWFVGNSQKYGFPKPDYKLYDSHPIVNVLVLYHAGQGNIKIQADVDRFEGKTAHFRDSASKKYDMILPATGYKLDYPFIDKTDLNSHGDAPYLYLNSIHPDRDDVFVMGMVEASDLGLQGRHDQSELVVRYIKGPRDGDPAAQTLNDTKAGGFDRAMNGRNYIDLPRMAYYVDKARYRKAVTGWIGKLAKAPKPLIIGLSSQFVLLPALTFGLVLVTQPQASVALGLILVLP